LTQGNGRSCIVLGGKGFVGSAVVAEGRRRGYAVAVVDKDEYAAHCGASCDVLINADGNSMKFLAAEDPKREFDLSVRSTEQSLHDFQFGVYVYLSTIDVYYPDVATPATTREDRDLPIARMSPYGFHKYLAEQIVRHDAAQWLIFRMGGFVGRGLWKNPVHDLLHGKPIRVHPDSEYQYLNTSDLAAAVFEVLERGAIAEVFNVTGEGVIALSAIAAMIPGCSLSALPAGLPRERYEVALDKIRQHVLLPATQDTVRHFIREALRAKGSAP